MHPPIEAGPARPVVLITGAAGGFGWRACLHFAKSGYRVVAAMRDMTKPSPLMEEAEKWGIQSLIHPVEMDVTRPEQIERCIAQILDAYGRIDVLVNNAGFALGGYAEEVSLQDWRRQMDTNFFGMVAVTQAVLPVMRTAGSGTVINVSSVSGRIGLPGYAPYSASKHAMEGFSESLRLEMLPYGVRVVLVEPGSYRTAIWQKGFDQISIAGDSPYHHRMETVLNHSRRTFDQSADPMEVAKLIVRVAQKKRPKLRYPIGRDARMLLIAKTLLPWKWLEKLVNSVLK
ncbi:SDR family oxidoreductase [Gorillibacterium sp. sgz5001074]|uniref:SDR family oxidoreductase n=1 Tax=Gorillibacterium sp. sgz5001074 TaxID=3446695 RepID=UPI003F66B3BC